ncbi:hypothetical protein K7432_010319 [Basidiobolus ranarum]|uniref:Uncharacterized protein n=1 Tax=Basidiobolus ranarum TaxID=34480 RepID=A0ABR2VWG4_9FUNG
MSNADDLIDPVEYLTSTLPNAGVYTQAQRLTGGLINYVWRVQVSSDDPSAPKSVVIKQSLPCLASDPEIQFSQERMVSVIT